jgi:hypothetical protein
MLFGTLTFQTSISKIDLFLDINIYSDININFSNKFDMK